MNLSLVQLESESDFKWNGRNNSPLLIFFRVLSTCGMDFVYYLHVEWIYIFYVDKILQQYPLITCRTHSVKLPCLQLILRLLGHVLCEGRETRVLCVLCRSSTVILVLSEFTMQVPDEYVIFRVVRISYTSYLPLSVFSDQGVTMGGNSDKTNVYGRLACVYEMIC